ncbi:MAG: DUF4395 domain-containing protein [Bacteroidia bacterium]
MLKNIACPVSFENVDNNVNRLTAVLNAAIMVWFLISLQPIILFVVLIDSGIRAFGYHQYSPICFLSLLAIKTLNVKPKLKDKAPKIFASRLGFICAVLGTVFILLGMPMASRLVIGLFCSLALLDGVLDFCVGCIIFHNLVLPFYQKRELGSNR